MDPQDPVKDSKLGVKEARMTDTPVCFWPNGMVTARCTEMETEKGAGLPGRWVCRRAHSGSDVSVWGSIEHPRGVQRQSEVRGETQLAVWS